MAATVIRIADVAADQPGAPQALVAGLGPGPFALIVLFLSPGADLRAVSAAMGAAHPGVPVTGCTTAGEIGPGGYAEGRALAVGLPAHLFAAEPLVLRDLDALNPDALIGDVIRARGRLAAARPGWPHDFAFLMVDGLSTREDALTAALSAGLGATPLFGGSAADGTRFLETFVLHGTEVLRHAAVLALVRTPCPVRVFKFDHFRPTETRMVVTDADPARRILHQINARPAAREYARLLGKDPGQLTPFTFAAHPVVVRVGGQHHVRSIRQVDDTGDLILYSAIDEGLVLSLAEPLDMVAHLEGALASLSRPVPPAAILGCDCMLRRMEAQEKQLTGRVSALLSAYGVTGFSTYGEQFGAMHVNQTLTGVAIYPPETAPPADPGSMTPAPP
jgi:hypothetical protein